MAAHSFLMLAVRCQTIPEINSYYILHNLKFKFKSLFFPASNYDSRCKLLYTARSLWHLAGQAVSTMVHRNRTFNRTWAILGQTGMWHSLWHWNSLQLLNYESSSDQILNEVKSICSRTLMKLNQIFPLATFEIFKKLPHDSHLCKGTGQTST